MLKPVTECPSDCNFFAVSIAMMLEAPANKYILFIIFNRILHKITSINSHCCQKQLSSNTKFIDIEIDIYYHVGENGYQPRLHTFILPDKPQNEFLFNIKIK